MSKAIQDLFTWTEENLSRGLPRASHNGNGIKSDQQELLCDSELENEATKFYEKIMASKDCQLWHVSSGLLFYSKAIKRERILCRTLQLETRWPDG